jgi:chromosome partitioning protein
MAHIIALANQKGGVGKTTSTVSLSAQLALLGFKVLLLDFDPQASATSGLGIERHAEGSDLYDVFFGRIQLASTIVPSSIPGLDVVPGSADLVSLELEIGKSPGRELILRSALGEVSEGYDFVLIDCPPSSGLLTLNALGAAHSVLVPLQAAMATFAATPSGLPDDVQKQLATQALLLKGHLLELNDALGKYQFDEYVSKTTKMTYSGGKVERELEEVCDTVDDYMALARGEAVEQRED